MDNNKYYTPTIEEFHVGFSFEVLNKEWEQQNLNASRLAEINFDDNTVGLSRYRVKCLDRDDIKSLGAQVVWSEAADIDFKLGDFFLSLKGSYLQIFKDKAPYFRGTVKNKSELKRILKQVGA